MIGIDLGTTHSLISYWDEKEETAKIISNVINEDITPSVVSILPNGEFVIGSAAKNRLLTEPQSSAATFKRKIASQSKYRLGKHSLTAVELSSMVLQQLKTDAEVFLGKEVTEAVISVPAYFNDVQRKSTIVAAKMAGLKVDRLINEPTAAAIAYGLHERIEESNFLVVDLGGGTLDVSLLEIFDGVIEVHACAGDNFLGGEDFTTAIIDDFCKKHSVDKEALTHEQRALIYQKLNSVKESLTNEHQIELQITINEQALDYALTRDEFDALVEPLLKRISGPIERVIRDSKLSVSEIEDVVLVGGATRMPCIRRLIGKLLRRFPAAHIDPDKVVALGAATQAALLNRASALEDVILTDICPYTLGVEVSVERGRDQFEAGHFLPIIERNSTIPKSKVERLNTMVDNQTAIRCNIFQGESRLTRNNVHLGVIEIEVPKAKAGESEIDVRFTYTADGILEVIVTVVGTDKSERVVIDNASSQLNEAEIEKRLKQLEQIKIHPRDDYPNTHLMSQLEKLYEQSLGEQRQYIAYLSQQFEQALESQDHEYVAKQRKELTEIVEQIIKDSSVF